MRERKVTFWVFIRHAPKSRICLLLRSRAVIVFFCCFSVDHLWARMAFVPSKRVIPLAWCISNFEPNKAQVSNICTCFALWSYRFCVKTCMRAWKVAWKLPLNPKSATCRCPYTAQKIVPPRKPIPVQTQRQLSSRVQICEQSNIRGGSSPVQAVGNRADMSEQAKKEVQGKDDHLPIAKEMLEFINKSATQFHAVGEVLTFSLPFLQYCLIQRKCSNIILIGSECGHFWLLDSTPSKSSSPPLSALYIIFLFADWPPFIGSLIPNGVLWLVLI